MFLIIVATLVAFVNLHIAVGNGVADPGNVQRCRCIAKEAKPMGRYIGSVEVSLKSSHCQEIEIIATLKQNGTKICLDPEAPWVKKVLNAIKKLPGRAH